MSEPAHCRINALVFSRSAQVLLMNSLLCVHSMRVRGAASLGRLICARRACGDFIHTGSARISPEPSPDSDLTTIASFLSPLSQPLVTIHSNRGTFARAHMPQHHMHRAIVSFRHPSTTKLPQSQCSRLRQRLIPSQYVVVTGIRLGLGPVCVYKGWGFAFPPCTYPLFFLFFSCTVNPTMPMDPNMRLQRDTDAVYRIFPHQHFARVTIIAIGRVDLPQVSRTPCLPPARTSRLHQHSVARSLWRTNARLSLRSRHPPIQWSVG